MLFMSHCFCTSPCRVSRFVFIFIDSLFFFFFTETNSLTVQEPVSMRTALTSGVFHDALFHSPPPFPS